MPIYAQSSTLRDLVIPLVDVDFGTLQQDDVLQYNSTTGKFENTNLSSSGANAVIVTGSNQGGGEEIFKQKTGSDLEFRTITASTGVAVSTVGDSIVISTNGASATGLNIGTGTGVFESKVSDDLRMRSLKTSLSSQHLTIALSGTGDEIEFTNTAEINTASNVGTGIGVFAQKNSENLEFKSIVAGDNIAVTSTATEVTVSAVNEPDTARKFQFTVSFDGSGNLNTISDIPVGWDITRVGNKITVVHTAGEIIKHISYLGRDAVNGWQMRFPTAGFQATVPSGSEADTFVIDLNASVAGADASSVAKVNVIF